MNSGEVDKNKLFKLPGIHHFKIVGSASKDYREKIESVLKEVLGADMIKNISERLSGKGSYTAYSIDAHVEDHSQLAVIHGKIKTIEGTKIIL
jgi:putative lipoic acid-binding regulatory protein